MLAARDKLILPTAEQALKGRSEPMPVLNSHYVHDRPIKTPFSPNDDKLSQVAFGLGCFWGAERVFWQLDGVYTTAAGYGGGFTPNPTYEEVCSGKTGHNELVLVVYQAQEISFSTLLKIFLESHNPTQGMRQGHDTGTQYRSGIYFLGAEQSRLSIAQQALESYQQQLVGTGLDEITTEIKVIENFYYAEDYHQQYLAKNPNGYCGLGGTGIRCDFSEG